MREELFDAERDPRELENRLEDEPEVAERLREQAERYLASQPPWKDSAPPLELDELQLNQLRALGYARCPANERCARSERDRQIDADRARLAREVDHDPGEARRIEREVLVDLVFDVADPARDLDVAGRRAIGEPHVVQEVRLLADRVLGQRGTARWDRTEPRPSFGSKKTSSLQLMS